jgi:transcriptional regulator with XRE-family HTH domain
MDLGRRVRDLRNARHLSQVELAARAGVARNTLNRIENGHLMPTAPIIEHLAEALDVVPGALFEEPVLPLAEPQPETGPADTTKGPDPLDGWIGRALSEGDFARDFERAKDSQDLADELRRAKDAEVTERNQAVATLRKRNAPPAEILEAQRDRVVSNAQLTAAAFLAVELWRGHDVSGTDPRSIVADVVRNQRELLLGGRRDEGESTAQAGKSA